MEPNLYVDPERLEQLETGIFTRAKNGDNWGSYDIAELTRESLLEWLNGNKDMMEKVILHLLEYY